MNTKRHRKRRNTKRKLFRKTKNRSRLKGGMSAKNSILAFSAAQAGKAVLLAQLKNKLNTVNIKIRQLQSSRLRKQPKQLEKSLSEKNKLQEQIYDYEQGYKYVTQLLQEHEKLNQLIEKINKEYTCVNNQQANSLETSIAKILNRS